MKTLTKAIIPVLILVALVVVAQGQTSLVVPGNVDIGQDLDVTDDLVVGDDSNVTGTSTMNHHSSSYLPQRYVIDFDESVWTNKVYPDTFVGMPMRTLFYAATAGMIVDVYFAVETAGTGWDSLLLDIRAGAAADSTVLTTMPQITPAVGDKSNTLTEGRQAVVNGTTRNLAVGEHVRIWGLVYGSKADPPTGLKAWVVFQPDYGN